MELYTKDLLLRTVTADDIEEVARMWEFEQGAISVSEAQKAIEYMRENHEQNHPGYVYHLCLAVFEKGKRQIIGWCGLDGKCTPGNMEIFYSIDESYRNRGYAAECAARLLDYAFNAAGLKFINGGCFKDNTASYRVMEKIGMARAGNNENGDPLFYVDKEAYRENAGNN